MKRLSQPIDSLLKGKSANSEVLRVDYLIVGSGYGGSVAALRLAGPDRSVAVLERGREYHLGDFPYDISDIPSHIRCVRGKNNGSGYTDALFNIHMGEQTDVLVGSGLGGTSLINANVAEEPPAHVFRKPQWPSQFRTDEHPLRDAFNSIRDLLNVSQYSSHDLPKFKALKRIGDALGANTRPANIAISIKEGKNSVGVNQNACTDCGNCVTGCNVGAKNTLDRNLIPLAISRGAEFYTGALVEFIEPHNKSNYRWKVVIQPTTQPTGTVEPERYYVLAKNVILAAGTLGSTEILLRSREHGKLELSYQLGKRFSTNGDGLIMSFAQDAPVKAVAEAEQKEPHDGNQIGPTITGIIQTSKIEGSLGPRQLVIEEASIPAALTTVFAELVTTGALFRRLSDRKLPPFFKRTGLDPLVGARKTTEHCQALLIMGDDNASGNLSLERNKTGIITGMKIDFPNVCKNPSLLNANTMISGIDRSAGLDHGQYVPNPFWELLPKEAAQVLSGKLPEGRALTVHPLGGCGMGDSAKEGVVNHLGNVFDPSSGVDATHEGLYVFDGAILPTALEINPFLTIAALSWRNCAALLTEQGLSESKKENADEAYVNLGPIPDRRTSEESTITMEITEQLTGELTGLMPWIERKLDAHQCQRLQEVDGLVVQVTAEQDNASEWLENPGKAPLNATMRLYVNPLSTSDVSKFRPVGVTAQHLIHCKSFLNLTGSFTILAEDPYNWFKDIKGGWKAIYTYLSRRGFSDLVETTGHSYLEKVWGFFKKFLVFFNIGVMQSRYRKIRYEFESDEVNITVRGEKILGYDINLMRIWPGLLNLDLILSEKNRKHVTAKLHVNVEHLVKPGLIRIPKSPNLPESIALVGSLAGFFSRCLISTSFWEFGGLRYPEKPVTQTTLPEPLIINGDPIQPEFSHIDVPLSSKAANQEQEEGTSKDSHKVEQIRLLLTRYRQSSGYAKPILLIHGLAQGSQIFWLNSIDENLASYFYKKGYDVWLLDYRLSNYVIPQLTNFNWSMDDIAQFDIPATIKHVYKSTQQKVSLFSHCVGSCTIAMAVLKGHVASGMIETLIANAIHPWVITSPSNRLRAKLASFFRDWVGDGLLNPVPSPEDNAMQNILDRLAFSLSKINELEMDDHRDFGGDELANGICDRMTFLYGRMWNHKNINIATHNNFINMLGSAPAQVYNHLYYYSIIRRITDRNGENNYLSAHNIHHNWTFPTLFIHGGDSRVFNPHSARRSAIRLSQAIRRHSAQIKSPISYHIFPDYGHMDPIIGKDANKACYPKYLEFLKQLKIVPDVLQESDSHTPYQERPSTGPLLRAAWLDKNNSLCLRYWVELRTNLTYRSTHLIVKGISKLEDETVIVPQEPEQPNYRFIDLSSTEPINVIEFNLKAELPHQHRFTGMTIKLDKQAWLARFRNRINGVKNENMIFLVGSCRFPGSMLDLNNSDSTFKAMLGDIEGDQGAHLVFFVGDQIYADSTDQLFRQKTQKAKYIERYRQAFRSSTSPYFDKLARQIPVHFAIDDHEIGDNWSGLPATADIQDKVYAINTAHRFQGSGRDQIPVGSVTYLKPFYYGLDYPNECQFPIFVMDTRTEREFRSEVNPKKYNLMSKDQYNVLVKWLETAQKNQPDAPKFIVSGSVLAPLPRDYIEQKSNWRTLDEWAGYPASMERLLAMLVDMGINNVVFVGGDAHLSAVAKLEIETNKGTTTAWQIVSSGLYSPMPFANARTKDFDWNSPQQYPVHTREDLKINVTNTLLSDNFAQFVKVDASLGMVKVTCIGANGEKLATELLPL